MIHKPIHNQLTYKFSHSLIHASTVNIIPAHVLFVHVNHNISPCQNQKYPVSRLNVCICVSSVRHTNRVVFALYCVTVTSKAPYNEGTEDNGPNITRVNKSRRARWARHVARMGETRSAYGIYWVNVNKRVTYKT